MNYGIKTIIYPVKDIAEVKDVGRGKLIALVKDADGNTIGLIQMS